MAGDRRKKGPRMAGGGQAGGEKVVIPIIAARRSASSDNSATPSDSSQDKFVIMPHRILRRPDLSAGAKLVLSAIRDRIGKNGAAWPGHPVIATDVGLSVSTVKRAIDDLESAGLLDTSSRGPGRSLLYKSSNLDQNDLQGKVKMTHGVGQIDLIENQTNEPNPVNQTNTCSTEEKPPKFSKAECESVYQAYPRKVGKAAALKAIDKALRAITKRGTLGAAAWLLDRVEKYAASPAGQQGKYTPHPATWFNQARHDDDDHEWTNTSGNDRSSREFPEPPMTARKL